TARISRSRNWTRCLTGCPATSAVFSNSCHQPNRRSSAARNISGRDRHIRAGGIRDNTDRCSSAPALVRHSSATDRGLRHARTRHAKVVNGPEHFAASLHGLGLRAVTEAGPQFGPPGYETDLLYLAALATLLLGGSGPWCIDRLIASRSTD